MDADSVEFSFSWKAMQLLGKSLYSNAWSAVSELVANGFDAGANNVCVLIDSSNKSSSIIEIMDDGLGMDRECIDTYAKVGYDRRLNDQADSPVPADEVMGRKGIGKLAALYLTNDYSIITKQDNTTSVWQIDRGSQRQDENPKLRKIDNAACTPLIPKWETTSSGTIIVMKDVDLGGIGEAGFDALSARLANQFLTSAMGSKRIELFVRSNPNTPIDFKPVKKNVAFFNLAFLASEFKREQDIPDDISKIQRDGNAVKMPLTSSKNSDLVERKTILTNLSSLQSDEYPIQGYYPVKLNWITDRNALEHRKDVIVEKDIVRIPYQLTGWIGLHATIRGEIAKENDGRFEKNRFYNPAQIRLYVRNKLASEELLNKLGITGAFANYIEGEISFDLLDDNLLPDIATSSRQGFDELDPRWLLLRNILRPIVGNLIRERQRIADELKSLTRKRQSSAKSAAYKTIEKELRGHEELNEDAKRDIGSSIISQFKGSIDLEAKEDYKVFLSHRSKDKLFTDFIVDLLLKRGANQHEIFYTSFEDDPERLADIHPLADQIKKNIISDNTLIAYFTSPHFLESEYCLFEGGAGWATRSVNDYLLLSTTYDGIPKYLTNQKLEMVFAPNEKVELNQQTYLYFIRFLNLIIEHLNTGREIKGQSPIRPFPKAKFPDKVERKKTGSSLRDYMDKEFLEYWDTYINDNLDQYLFRRTSNGDKGQADDDNLLEST